MKTFHSDTIYKPFKNQGVIPINIEAKLNSAFGASASSVIIVQYWIGQL